MVLNNTTVVTVLQYTEPLPSTCFRIACYVLFTASSILGNSIVIKSIISIEHRRPLTYILVANLAFAELIGSLILPALLVYDEIYTWPFGDFLCHVLSPTQVVSCLVITWILAIISVYRFLTLFNIGYGVRYSHTRRNLFLVVMWIAALGVCSPMFVYSRLMKSPFDHSSWCVVLFKGDTVFDFPSFKKYILVRFVVNFIVPMLIMLVFYGAMVVRLKCHMTNQISPITNVNDPERSMEMHLSIITKSTIECSTLSNELNQPPSSPPSTGNPRLQTRSPMQSNGRRNKPKPRELEDNVIVQLDQDLLKMIYVVVSIFIICFLPYQVFYLMEYFGVVSYKNWQYFRITRQYIFLVTCIPSALHPMCYGTMSSFYAKAFAYVFLCKFIKKLFKK